MSMIKIDPFHFPRSRVLFKLKCAVSRQTVISLELDMCPLEAGQMVRLRKRIEVSSTNGTRANVCRGPEEK